MSNDRLNKLLKLVEADPGDAFCLYALAQEYGRCGSHEEAIRCYDRVIAVDPDYFYAYYHKAVTLCACVRINDARAVLRAGLARPAIRQDSKAQSELQEYLRTLPEHESQPPSSL